MPMKLLDPNVRKPKKKMSTYRKSLLVATFEGFPAVIIFQLLGRTVFNGLFDLFGSNFNRDWLHSGDYHRREHHSNCDGCRHAKIPKSETHADYFRILSSIVMGFCRLDSFCFAAGVLGHHVYDFVYRCSSGECRRRDCVDLLNQ